MTTDQQATEALEANRAWNPSYNHKLYKQISAVLAIAKRAIQVEAEKPATEQKPEPAAIDPGDVTPEWPKWYVHKNASLMFYVKRISTETAMYCEREDKTRFDWGELESSHLASGGWLEVTESEALARITPPAPLESLMNCPDCGEFRGHGHECKVAEDPEEWIELPPEHALRKGVDELLFSCGRWFAVEGMDGKKIGRLYDKARCRRKHLPQQPTESATPEQEEPATKRVPVRLWCMDIRFGESGGGVVVANPDTPPDGDIRYREIKSDSNGGWFVEVPA